MPLVSALTTAPASKTEEWQNKLVGKTLCDGPSTPTVPLPPPSPLHTPRCLIAHPQAFAKSSLPDDHRIVPAGAKMTRDLREDRLNIYLNDDGIVSHVAFG